MVNHNIDYQTIMIHQAIMLDELSTFTLNLKRILS